MSVLIGLGIAALLISFLSAAFLETFHEKNYIKVNVLRIVQGDRVVFGNNCTAIVARTSPERAKSIQLGLKDEIEIRPMTHDLFSSVLDSFNITLSEVRITKLEEGIYYSTMRFKEGNKVLKLDAKPSDAIAVALRTDSPIYVNKNLLEEEGQNICKD